MTHNHTKTPACSVVSVEHLEEVLRAHALIKYVGRMRIGCEGVPLAECLSPQKLESTLSIMEYRYPHASKRAQVSQWFKHFSSLCLPQALMSAVVFQSSWFFSLHNTRIIFDEEGWPVALTTEALPLLAPLSVKPKLDLDDYYPWLKEFFSPLIAILSKYGKVAEKVLWNSMGNLMEYLLRILQTRYESSVMAHEQWLFGSPHSLIPRPIDYEKGYRRRRLCCLRYELETLSPCSTCPLQQKIHSPSQSL
jgi:ferric iron reductase protein FhuF